MLSEKGLDVGIDRIMYYDNIAIVVLAVVVLLQWTVIGVLIRAVLTGDSELKQILKDVWTTISTLNERLHGVKK